MPQFREVVRTVINHFVTKIASGNASAYLRVAESYTFSLQAITEPTQPAEDAGRGPWVIYTADYKDYRSKLKDRESQEASLFALLVSQSSDQFIQAAREHTDWASVSANFNTMGLLTIFQAITASGGVTNMDPIQLQTMAQERYFKFYQSAEMTNAEYYSAFTHHANIARYCGCAMGASLTNLLELCLEDGLDAPGIQDLEDRIETAIEREMAMVFLTHANKDRYSDLVNLAVNNRLLSNGAQTFPTTMAAALDLLNSSRPLVSQKSSKQYRRSSDIGASFLNEGSERETPNDRNRRSGGRGRGPDRNGRGGRGGRGGGGGRGRGQPDQHRNHNREHEDTHINDGEDEGQEDPILGNNNDEIEA